MTTPLSDGDERGLWLEAMNYVVETAGHAPSLFAETVSKTIPIEPRKTRLLDIGCGCGIVGIFCLVERAAAFVTFNDIQDEMILAARLNVERQIAKGTISESQVSYLRASFVDIEAQSVAQHDLLCFNPPQLPEKALSPQIMNEFLGNPSLSYFRLGGPDGLNVVRQFLGWYSQLNAPAPRVVMLLSSFLGMSRIRAAIEGFRLELGILARTGVPLRGFLSEAAERFSPKDRADRSLVKDGHGKWTKELLTISLNHAR